MFKSLLAIVAISATAAGCAKSTEKAAAPAPAPIVAEELIGPDTTKAAIIAFSDQVGVDQKYVATAMNEAAKRVTPENNTAFDKEIAAKRGVEKAVHQAASEGRLISVEQQMALIDGIKKLL